jgi:hypothetical protein
VRPSLRETLADTHIAAVTVAVLIVGALDGTFQALWAPLSSVAGFLLTASIFLLLPGAQSGGPPACLHDFDVPFQRCHQLFNSLAS